MGISDCRYVRVLYLKIPYSTPYLSKVECVNPNLTLVRGELSQKSSLSENRTLAFLAERFGEFRAKRAFVEQKSRGGEGAAWVEIEPGRVGRERWESAERLWFCG